MIHPVSKMRAAVRHARFDPRAVVTGLVLLFLAALGGFTLAGVTASKADQVIKPVATICRQNTAASFELNSAGACSAADQARHAGPYVITRSGAAGQPGNNGPPGRDSEDGTAGEPGQPGVPGTPATPGPGGEPGPTGEPGEPGASPACLDEPAQCRGADGRDGVDGIDGQDGRDGRDGSAVASQTFALSDGRILTCARTGGTDLDPMYRCQQTQAAAEPTPEPTS